MAKVANDDVFTTNMTFEEKLERIADFIENELCYLVQGIKYTQDPQGRLYLEILADKVPTSATLH